MHHPCVYRFVILSPINPPSVDLQYIHLSFIHTCVHLFIHLLSIHLSSIHPFVIHLSSIHQSVIYHPSIRPSTLQSICYPCIHPSPFFLWCHFSSTPGVNLVFTPLLRCHLQTLRSVYVHTYKEVAGAGEREPARTHRTRRKI